MCSAPHYVCVCVCACFCTAAVIRAYDLKNVAKFGTIHPQVSLTVSQNKVRRDEEPAWWGCVAVSQSQGQRGAASAQARRSSMVVL